MVTLVPFRIVSFSPNRIANYKLTEKIANLTKFLTKNKIKNVFEATKMDDRDDIKLLSLCSPEKQENTF